MLESLHIENIAVIEKADAAINDARATLTSLMDFFIVFFLCVPKDFLYYLYGVSTAQHHEQPYRPDHETVHRLCSKSHLSTVTV